jgi:membrane protein implicated in regulation of membrane protease activity
VLDLGIDLNVWPWVWLGIAVFFAIIELTVLAGTFVLLPFSISAFAASLLGFYNAPIEFQWLVFAGGGAVLWVILYRYAQRFAGENEMSPGVGADRVVGLTAIVTATIDPDDTDRRGRVSVHGEVWGALTDQETPLVEGSKVRVSSVNGTRVVVEPLDPTTPPPLPTSPPSKAAPTSTTPPPPPTPPTPPSDKTT